MDEQVAEQLVVRPYRARWVAWIAAAVLIGIMTTVAMLLRSVSTGVYFHTDDQVAMVLLGVLMAVAILVPAHAVVHADADGVRVRNLLITRTLAWSDILEVGFPPGARWARLELPYDEYLPVSAIQLVDGQRAVRAMDRLRALHAGHHRATGSAAGPAQVDG
ncbi:MAG TPA: PH domain-containing protein [Pseudonocardia sp.]